MAWATLETGALAWGVNARDVRLWPLAAARIRDGRGGFQV